MYFTCYLQTSKASFFCPSFVICQIKPLLHRLRMLRQRQEERIKYDVTSSQHTFPEKKSDLKKCESQTCFAPMASKQNLTWIDREIKFKNWREWTSAQGFPNDHLKPSMEKRIRWQISTSLQSSVAPNQIICRYALYFKRYFFLCWLKCIFL